MATPGTGSSQISPDTPIVIKVAIKGANRKFKLPLRELNATNLPQKVSIPPHDYLAVQLRGSNG